VALLVFSCIVAVSFIGVEKKGTRRNPQIFHKSLTNVIT